MSANEPETTEREQSADERDDAAEHAARAELLAAENRRLRAEYARTKQARYGRTALGLAALGLLALGGGFVFPDVRDVLFVLAAIGLFGAVLTRYLSPGQFVAADVGERVYAALARNEAAIVDELGIRGDPVYVPRTDGPATVFVPQGPETRPPPLERDAEFGPIVVEPAHRGLLLEATGAALFREFERTVSGTLADRPAGLAAQLADGLTDGLELVGRADPDVDERRVTVAVTDSAFGDVDRFDHPVASFLAVGFATGLERPVELTVEPADGRADWLVTCRWTA